MPSRLINSNLRNKNFFQVLQNKRLQVASKETCSNFKHIHESNSNEIKKRNTGGYNYMWVGMHASVLVLSIKNCKIRVATKNQKILHIRRTASRKSQQEKNNSTRKNNSIRKHILYLYYLVKQQFQKNLYENCYQIPLRENRQTSLYA